MIVVQPTSPPVTIDALAVQQSVLLRRISSLMSSLSELKMRLAVLDDPKVDSEINILCFTASPFSFETPTRTFLALFVFSCSRCLC